MDKSAFYEEIMDQGFVFSKIGDSILLKKIITNKNQSSNICDNTAPVTQMMFDNRQNAENFVKGIIGWKDVESADKMIPMSEVEKMIQAKEEEFQKTTDEGYQEAANIILDLRDKLANVSTSEPAVDLPTPMVEQEYDSYIMFNIGFGITSQNLGFIKHYSPEEAQITAEKRAYNFFKETYPQENYENVPKKINIRLKY